MPEQTFKSPGFFEREIDLSGRVVEITGVPAGIAGTSEMGPAFVPVTVGSMTDFVDRFGNVSADLFGPFAVREFLRNRTAVTFVRVLGAGANSTTTHFSNTDNKGIVNNAGFIIKGNLTSSLGESAQDERGQGNTVFLSGIHQVDTEHETTGFPIFTDNRTFDISGGSTVNLVRGIIFCASGSRIEVLDHNESYAVGGSTDDAAKISSYDGTDDEGTFKLVLSSALGATYGNEGAFAGLRVLKASLDPTSKHYISKILNTNPDRFHQDQHLLYADFPVESEIAKVKYDASNPTVAVLSGSSNTNSQSGDTTLSYKDAYGRFDTRYSNARTTSFISQPFGDKEYDLFHFETITDGESANSKFKVSISNLKRSTNPKDPYGTFNVEIRRFNDTDTNPQIVELYSNCNLNPKDDNYVARLIGDFKTFYDFDAETESERRLNVTGKYPNKSRYVRIVMNAEIENTSNIPKESLPFGFRGLPSLQTTSTLTDDNNTVRSIVGGTRDVRLGSALPAAALALTSSVVPPVPFRFKATRNAVKQTVSPSYIGEAGPLEVADSRFYWGVKFERVPLTASVSNSVLNANGSSTPNPILSSYSKLLGIQKLGVITSGSSSDLFNDNKFSLSKVALNNRIAAGENLYNIINSTVTGSANDHILETAYLRDKDPVAPQYYVVDDTASANRLTFASLAAAQGDNAVSIFNRFSNYLKFTNLMYGGFDGVNILDRDMKRFNDKATSSDAGGKAAGGTLSRLNLTTDYSPGVGKENNAVVAYRTAARILTDELSSRINILTIPGIRDSFVTDYASDLVRDYSQAIYLMDLPNYDSGGNRLFDDSLGRPSVRKTRENFSSRALDNNYVATYFPDVKMVDEEKGSVVDVPASVAALSAIGFNDNVSYPWFAPAGFNRGALENVVNTQLRLTTSDRDDLYEDRINPIANFPNGGFVIFGQKTLQQARSALDRVNVRRMLLEVKRIVSDVAYKIVFEQNTPSTRARFVAQVTPLLATIQSQQGIDQFRVVMDSSNNTSRDIEENRLNGRIVLVPTRAIEFIAIDFIVTNSGVSFE